MSIWKIVLLHTRRETLLKKVLDTAFPGQVHSLHTPLLGRKQYWKKPDLVDYFKKHVYDPGIWKDRVLTIYGDGEFHQYTYALTRLACNRRGLHSWDWTYFHVDNHRDDWGKRNENGEPPSLTCSNFVDSIAHDTRGIPFFVGPVVYANKDSRGFRMHGQEIPIFHNQFPKSLQQSRNWRGSGGLWGLTSQAQLPAISDLLSTPREAYLSLDLDLLHYSEIVTNFDQGHLKLPDLCRILTKIREYKRVFSADILGFPDSSHHALSALTVLILAKAIMKQGHASLLDYYYEAKRKQASMMALKARGVLKDLSNNSAPVFKDWMDKDRPSPIEEGTLLEVIK